LEECLAHLFEARNECIKAINFWLLLVRVLLEKTCQISPDHHDKLGKAISADKLISILSDEAWVWLRVYDSPINIFCNPCDTQLLPPTLVEIDVVKHHSSAGVQRATPEKGWQPSVVNCHVAKSEVYERHLGVGITRHEGIQNAAWAF